jgi:hypothetical protein
MKEFFSEDEIETIYRECFEWEGILGYKSVTNFIFADVLIALNSPNNPKAKAIYERIMNMPRKESDEVLEEILKFLRAKKAEDDEDFFKQT